MPLFVPVLRLLMLFLNVYDSYKTLKDPPPSSRNGGRPTVRAVSQRKRDMKGCLAVWIVWTSLAIYERTVESLISLFIPFYDEIKSLVLLFLILTRARGAEPIYLHVIRPFVKPYTRTLDAALDIMLTFGDFIFALSTYPLRLALRWWQRRFGKYYEPFETEADSQSELSSNEVNTSEVPSSILASSAPGLPPLPPDPPEAAGVQLASKASQGKRPADSQARRPSQDRPSRIAGARGNSQAGPSHSLPRKRKDSDNRSESGAESTTRHQIWYPPQAAYANEDPEEEAQANLTIKPSVQAPEPPKDANATLNEAQRLVELQQLDEWRQYPPFPSAYPPTPIATTARLIPSSMALPSSLYPPIEEEMAQQDFRQSLLPLREPLNPTHAGDSSDRDNTNFGIYHYLANQQLAKDTDDSISTSDDYEDEDEDAFNVTLRTPLPPQGSARSQIYSRRFVSLASASSMANIVRLVLSTWASHAVLNCNWKEAVVPQDQASKHQEPGAPGRGRRL
ncbi:hypothetical protein NLJ89_g11975 [Agrocybe chaxingu]|uniref:Protein YOP1 n=1 Tax=Agrocybe chaxingu TaxID=84603 RepID=A0A9W8JP39_9AGAR|nr:hypothetical protein NLJ89_g11975 [Agrocybe chaxingu]